MNVSLAELRLFLVEAKSQTYAAEDRSAAAPPLLRGSQRFAYQKGSWLYEDAYFGSTYFAGQEVVYYLEQPVWSMVYAGGIILSALSAEEIQAIYAFLRTALRRIEPENPYRGPAFFQQGLYAYETLPHGELARFWGSEVILRQGITIYTLHYAGGLLRG